MHDGAAEITLEDLYDMINNPRELVFEVCINEELNFDKGAFKCNQENVYLCFNEYVHTTCDHANKDC